jgi:hypothetical protein
MQYYQVGFIKLKFTPTKYNLSVLKINICSTYTVHSVPLLSPSRLFWNSFQVRSHKGFLPNTKKTNFSTSISRSNLVRMTIRKLTFVPKIKPDDYKTVYDPLGVCSQFKHDHSLIFSTLFTLLCNKINCKCEWGCAKSKHQHRLSNHM